MLVSNFEILINRITGGPGAPVNPLNRRVVQGYFLSITNLDTRDLNLNLTVLSSKSTPGPGDGTNIDRDFIPVTNAVMVFDNAPQNNFALNLVQAGTAAQRASANIFRTSNMPAIKYNQTALVAIFPAPSLSDNLATALEIRGHVKLNLVPNLNGSLPAPYKVMLSAEQRGTFLDDNTADGVFDFDQIAYSLSLASGKAENTLAD
jgi:hypothetical protein